MGDAGGPACRLKHAPLEQKVTNLEAKSMQSDILDNAVLLEIRGMREDLREAMRHFSKEVTRMAKTAMDIVAEGKKRKRR